MAQRSNRARNVDDVMERSSRLGTATGRPVNREINQRFRVALVGGQEQLLSCVCGCADRRRTFLGRFTTHLVHFPRRNRRNRSVPLRRRTWCRVCVCAFLATSTIPAEWCSWSRRSRAFCYLNLLECSVFFSIHELMELGVSGRFASISRTDKDSSINLKVDQLT